MVNSMATTVINSSGWFIESALTIASCVAIVANVLVIFIFIRRPGLRTVSNRFVINLLVTNLISSTVLIPLLLADEITKRTNIILTSSSSSANTANTSMSTAFTPPFINYTTATATTATATAFIQTEGRAVGDTSVRAANTTATIVTTDFIQQSTKYVNTTQPKQNTTTSSIVPVVLLNVTNATPLCYFAEGFTHFVCTASILSILLIAIDQYFAVVHPLRYHTRIDQYKSIILIAASWLASIVFGILGAVTPNKHDSLWNFCKRSNVSNTTWNYNEYIRIIYTVVYFLLVILIPFIAICVIYLSIYSAAHKNSERMRHTNSGSITINVESYTPVQVIDDESKSDITEDGLTLKLDESNYSYKHSLETLNETPSSPEMNIEDWTTISNSENKEIKKVHSVPLFNTLEDEDTVAVKPLQKSPSVENVKIKVSVPVIYINKAPNFFENVRKLSIFGDYYRRKSTTSDSMSVTPIGTPKPRAGSLKSTHSFMNALRCRISNASMFRYREETRAAKISIIVIVMVLVCYIPYGVALLLHLTMAHSTTLSIFDSISLVHLVFSCVISPFLFAYRSRRIKREIRKLFRPSKLDADLQKLKNPSSSLFRRNSNFKNINNHLNVKENGALTPFLTVNNVNNNSDSSEIAIVENVDECKSILKRVCDKTKIWNVTKKTCNFMTVPDCTLNVESRSSFSSQNSTPSTQVSTTATDDSADDS